MAVLHVTLLYAGLMGLFLVMLSFNMTKHWVRATTSGHSDNGDLRRAEALITSFTDYVPTALLLLGLLEVGGAPGFALHLLGGSLIIARLMHAFGSNRRMGSDALRFLGTQMTYLVITMASFACLYAYAMPQLILK